MKLGDVCHVIMGQAPSGESYNEEGKGLPLLAGAGDFGEIYPNPHKSTTEPTKISEHGDIILCIRATIGDKNWSDKQYCLGRGVAAIRPRKNAGIDSQYLWYWIEANENVLKSKGKGSTFLQVTRSDIEELYINLPSIEQQRRIACILTSIYELFLMRKQQVAKLDELVKSRFVEMFGNEQNSLNFPVVKIGNVADVSVGVVIKPAQYYTDKESGVRAFRSLNVGKLYIRDNDWVYFSQEGNKKNAKSILRENDLIIVRSGDPGTSCVITREYAGSNAIDVIIARPNITKINPYYLCAFTNFPHGKEQIKLGTGGAAQQHFNVGKYKDMNLALPPISLQNQFAAFVEQTEKTKASIKQSLNRLETLKKALMQEFFG